MGLLSFLSTVSVAHSHSRFNKSIDVVERFGKNELYVNGIQQSGPYTIRLWKKGLEHILNNVPQKAGNILVLGIGGGTLFPILLKSFSGSHITAVDIDQEIITLYSEYFSGNAGRYVSLVCADALKFVAEEKRKFILIIVDLYVGNDVPVFVTGIAFLKALKKIVAPHGTVLFNYFSDKNQWEKSQIFLAKLSRIYQSVIRKQILRNVFYYCGKIG